MATDKTRGGRKSPGSAARAAGGGGAGAPGARPVLAATRARARATDEAAPSPSPSKGGRPAYVPSDRDRSTVRVMVAGGVEQMHICAVLKISVRSLRRHFGREIAAGAAEANAAVIASLFRMATRGDNFPAAKWWSQARMGWSERVTLNVSDERSPSQMTDAEIDARLAQLSPRPRLRVVRGSD
jgi:hypothetical protein